MDSKATQEFTEICGEEQLITEVLAHIADYVVRRAPAGDPIARPIAELLPKLQELSRQKSALYKLMIALYAPLDEDTSAGTAETETATAADDTNFNAFTAMEPDQPLIPAEAESESEPEPEPEHSKLPYGLKELPESVEPTE